MRLDALLFHLEVRRYPRFFVPNECPNDLAAKAHFSRDSIEPRLHGLPAISSSSQKTRSPGPDYPQTNSLPAALETNALTAVIANDKPRHRIFPPNHRRIIEGRFHTVWTPFGRRPVSRVTVDVAVAVEFANVKVAELASQKQCPLMTAFGRLFNAE